MKTLAVAAVLCLVPVSISGQSEDAERSEARNLWEQMLVAKGGRDRLLGVKSMVQTERLRLFAAKPGLKDTKTEMVRLFIFPDREWQWYDAGSTVFGLSLYLYNIGLNFGYSVRPSEPPHELEDLRSGANTLWETQLTYLHESASVHPEPVRILRTPGLPRGQDVIETKLDHRATETALDYRADFFLDRRTHLPVNVLVYQLESRWKPVHVVITGYALSKYRKVDGIMLPGRVTYSQPPGSDGIDADYDIELNVPYREDVFTHLPSLEAGPYAWRPDGPK